MTEIRILVLVIACSQFLDFSHSYSFHHKMQLIVTVIVTVILLITVMMSVLHVHSTIIYAHAYTVPNASSPNQSVYECTMSTHWK